MVVVMDAFCGISWYVPIEKHIRAEGSTLAAT